jgi:hypothetical protein
MSDAGVAARIRVRDDRDERRHARAVLALSERGRALPTGIKRALGAAGVRDAEG